uniref:Polyprotein n=1 Tax=Melampyrum betaflexivirus 1 TaxID=2794405 RepID=A0A7T5UEW7_9VIRU|nr:polyprotein [Melampyrum betaflexivirus 1]
MLCNFNRCITVKDFSRYGIDRKAQLADCLKTKPELKGSNFIIHDEVHYWSPMDMHNFISYNEPNSILATLVHPVEYETGYRQSMMPEIYEFTIRGNSLFFFPDGNTSEAYEQPASAGWLLHCSTFRTKQYSYGVTRLKTIGPFHLILLKKNCSVSESRRFFSDFSCVSLPKSISMRGSDFGDTRLSGEVFRKIVRYVLSLKKPDKESVMAKLRMMDDESKDLEQSLLCAKLTNSLLKDGILQNFDLSMTDWLLDGIKDCFGPGFQQLILNSHFKSKSNLEILMNMRELKVEIQTKEIGHLYDHGSFLHTFMNKVSSLCKKDESDGVIDLFKRMTNSHFPTRGQILFHGNQGYFSSEEKIVDGLLTSFIVGINDEYGHYCIESHVDRVYDEICCGDLRLELEHSFFWHDKERVKRAMNISLAQSSTFDTDFFLVKTTKIGPYQKVGLKYLIFGNGFMSSINVDSFEFSITNAQILRRKILKFFLNTGCMHGKPLTNETEGVFERKKKDMPLFERLVLDFEKKNPTLSPHEEDFVPESQVFNKENTNIGSVELDGFKNSCCFIAAKEYLGLSDEEFLAKIPDKFINKLIKDDGLLTEEFICLLNSLHVNFLICSDYKSEIATNESNSTTNGKIGVFELAHDHCKFLGSEEDIDAARSTFGLINKSFGGNSLKKKSLVNPSSRVEKLIDCFGRGFTGVMVKSIIDNDRNSKRLKPANIWRHLPNKKKLEDLIEHSYLNNNVFITLGAAGSGKSSCLIEAITTGEICREKTLVISPRKALKDDFTTKIECNKNVEVVTFEKAFDLWYLYLFDNIVVDEISLYPPGFFDLLMISSQVSLDSRVRNQIKKDDLSCSGKNFYLLGDFAQVRYFGNDDSPRLDRNDEIDYLGGRVSGSISYRAYSFRSPADFTFNLGHENLGENAGCRSPRFFINCQVAFSALPESQILVASIEEQNKFKNFNARTFGSMQGITLNDVLICLSPATLSCDNSAIYVALSRAKRNVDFFLHGYTSKDEFMERCRGSCLAGILSINSFDFISVVAKKNFERSTKKEVIMVDRKGLSQLDIENKLEGDPYLKSIIPLCEPIINYVEACRSPVYDHCNPKIHLPIWEKNNYCSEVLSRMRNREDREFFSGSRMSEQFPDFFKKGEPQSLLPNPCRFQGIYPKHSNSDPITFFAAVKKRLKFSCPAKEREKFENVLHLGEEMFHCFLEKVPIDGKLEKDLMEQSEFEYVQKKTSKSGPTIASHVARSDPDWGKHEIFLFIKTQLCTKYEKRFCDAKAGQTLACFSHKLLNRFAAPCRYLEKKLQKALPERFYIHQKKDFNELNDWVIKHDFSGICTESDYEAFDSSQDALILAMEYAFLKHIQWDKSLIEDYLDMKFNLGCRLGNLAVMRFTGEFGTFILNTICNMAFTFMTYEIDSSVAISFAGDDMCANKPLVLRGEDGPYEHILSKLTLRAKVDRTRNPTFCGWRLTKSGLYKRPELILDRLMISEEKGTFHETLDGYLLEFSYAYKLGEWLFESFSEKEFQAHYLCTRLFVKNRRKISQSLQSFVDKLEDRSVRKGKCPLSRRMSSSSRTIQETNRSSVFTRTQYTRILALPRPNLLMLFKGTSAQYLSNHPIPQALSQVCPLFIKEQLSKRKGRVDTNGSTLGPYQLAYTSLDIMAPRKPLGLYSLSMVGKREEIVWSKHMILTYQKNQPIIYLCQMQIFLLTMSSCIGHVRCMLGSTTIYTKKAVNHSQLKLGQSSDSQMLSIVCIKWGMLTMVHLVVITRKFSIRSVGTLKNILRLPRSIMMNYLNQVCFCSNLHRDQILLKEKEAFGGGARGAHLDSLIIKSDRFMMSTQPDWLEVAQLGQALKILMNLELVTNFWTINLETRLASPLVMESRNKKMTTAVKRWIYSKDMNFTPRTPPNVTIMRLRRRMLLRNHYVMVIHKMFEDMNFDVEKWTLAQKEKYERIIDDFAMHAFGNLAVYGFSEATKYPNHNIEYKVIEEVENPEKKTNENQNQVTGSGTQEVASEYSEYSDEEITVCFKLPELRLAFKYYADNSGVDELEGLTWRQIGECFAEDVRSYLRDIEPETRTWLVSSNPVLAGGAPWVATDITGGLWKSLSPEEKKVITRVNNHLL